ncbi:helix-turn-helix domain-containing protein [Serpentinicella alkaliphila]|uniref:helix-turn-helix domain-containing protein n=1 Tax=Serpentinicella alkaliphila TaxID=1734049 RepID=UPI0014049796|nr:helix-turn-helix domain-containing protein [Serpentinicella alkaliphila]QUH25234.1 helix-turn-helix domain-containing protein [Serpentinicella alkaliphila]
MLYVVCLALIKLNKVGKLAAFKIGKQWRISEQDLIAFVEENNIGVNRYKHDAVASIEYSITDLAKRNKQRINVSTVVDISQLGKEEYIRISNTLIAITNCNEPEKGNSTIQVKYDERDRRVRVILWGSVEYIEGMLSSITMLIDSK